MLHNDTEVIHNMLYSCDFDKLIFMNSHDFCVNKLVLVHLSLYDIFLQVLNFFGA